MKVVKAGRLVYGVCYSQPMAHDTPKERAAKTKCSTAARQRLNFRAAWQKLELEIAANFGREDWFITLTYDDENIPLQRDFALCRLSAFIRKVRAQRKQQGEDLKYIHTTEELPDEPGGEKRLHHHMIINAGTNDKELFESLWTYGLVHITPLLTASNDSYEARARYMVKERQPGAYGRKTGLRSWTPSRNLEKPKTTSELVPANVAITAPPGAYILDRHEETNYFGTYSYIKYLLPEPPKARRKAQKSREKARHKDAYIKS